VVGRAGRGWCIMDRVVNLLRRGIGAGAVAAATVSDLHLVMHQHWNMLHSPATFSLFSAKHVRLHPLSLINPKHSPLKLPLRWPLQGNQTLTDAASAWTRPVQAQAWTYHQLKQPIKQLLASLKIMTIRQH
jgi:hypothetical protein